MTLIPIEVNVQGKSAAEVVVLLAKADVRKVVAGLCGLTNNDVSKVKVSFHPISRKIPPHDFVTPYELMIEIIVRAEHGMIQPYADQLRDWLMRTITDLRQYKVGISVPGQSYPHNSAVSQPEYVRV